MIIDLSRLCPPVCALDPPDADLAFCAMVQVPSAPKGPIFCLIFIINYSSSGSMVDEWMFGNLRIWHFYVRFRLMVSHLIWMLPSGFLRRVSEGNDALRFPLAKSSTQMVVFLCVEKTNFIFNQPKILT